jgi:hypothetical protein
MAAARIIKIKAGIRIQPGLLVFEFIPIGALYQMKNGGFCNQNHNMPYIILEATMSEPKHVPFLLWPFYAIWKLIELIFNLTGRLVGVVLGLVLMIVGIVLTVTVIGAIVGIPFIVIGVLLTLRSIF